MASQRSGSRVHDGFYLRLALGAAYGKASVETDRLTQPDVALSGFGAGLDLWAGFTVSTGVVIGPALSLSGIRSSAASISARSSSSGAADIGLLGAFIDAYPNPTRGEHFGGMLGLASLRETTGDGETSTDYEAGGVGLSIFAGYDLWIGREWSLGGLLRLGGTVTRGSETVQSLAVTKQGTTFGAALLFTVVYH